MQRMRAISRLCTGLLLVLVATPAFADTPRWVLYTHPEKTLSVRFPGTPTESDQDAPSPIGNVHFKMAMYADEVHAFVAAAVDYPVKDMTFNVKKALDGARDQMVANIKGKVTSEKPVTLDGLQGREVWFEATGSGQPIHGIARLFATATPPQAFIISAMRMNDKPDPDAKKFLDSIHLGKKVETK